MGQKNRDFENNGDDGTELYVDSVKLGMRECDGQEIQENKEDEEERREEARKISNCSTFTKETLDELSQRFPTYLSEQYKDISTDNDNIADTDTANDIVEKVIKPSHIQHLVLNNQCYS